MQHAGMENLVLDAEDSFRIVLNNLQNTKNGEWLLL